jgi:hypothetical protein
LGYSKSPDAISPKKGFILKFFALPKHFGAFLQDFFFLLFTSIYQNNSKMKFVKRNFGFHYFVLEWFWYHIQYVKFNRTQWNCVQVKIFKISSPNRFNSFFFSLKEVKNFKEKIFSRLRNLRMQILKIANKVFSYNSYSGGLSQIF